MECCNQFQFGPSNEESPFLDVQFHLVSAFVSLRIRFERVLRSPIILLLMHSYGAAIPPVAWNTFDWSTVQISNVLAAQAVVLFVGMNGSMGLLMTGVPDSVMIAGGNLCFVVGGAITYFWWNVDAAPWQFVSPIMLISLAYPFMGPANRSSFTKAMHDHPGQWCGCYFYHRIIDECLLSHL